MSDESHRKCAHCGNEIPLDRDGSFCCPGCEQVYHMIQDEGLGDFYTMLDEPIKKGSPISSETSRYNWLQERLQEAELRATGRTAELKISLKGAHCGGCIWLIEQIFFKSKGSQHCEMDLTNDILSLWWLKGGFDIRGFAETLEQHGFEIPMEKGKKTRSEPLLSLCLGVSFAALIALFCIIPSVVIHRELDTDYDRFVHLLLFCSGTLSFFLGGGFFISSTLKGYRPWMRYWPAAFAAILGYAICLYGFFYEDPKWLHFEVYSCSVAVYMWGRYFVEKVKSFYEKRFVREDLLPHRFNGVADKGEDSASFPLNELNKERLYSVAPGKLVPVCSVLVEGEAKVSLGYRGRDKFFSFKAPHRIPAGSMNNGNNHLKLKSLEDWENSDLHIQADLLGTFRSQNLDHWPQLAGIVFSVCYLALAIAIGLFMHMGFDQMVLPICAVLLVLSTGSLSWGRHWLKRLSLLRLASYGMYVPNVENLKHLLKVDRIRFTEPGDIVLQPPQMENDTPLEMLTSEQRGVLLAIVGKGKHPAANSLMERLLIYPCDVVEIQDFKEIVGSGYTCTYKGEEWSAGLVGWRKSNKEQMLQETKKWDCEFYKAGTMLCTLAFLEVAPSASDEVCGKLQRKFGIVVQRSPISGPIQENEMIIGDSDSKCLKMIPVIGNRWLKKKAEIYLFGGQLTHLVDLFDCVYNHFKIRKLIYFWIVVYHLLMLLLIFGYQLPLLPLVFMAPIGSLIGVSIMGEGFSRKRKAGL